MKRCGILFLLAAIPALLAAPALAQTQERVLFETATARDCERASAEVLRKLVEDHGGVLFERVWRDHLRLDGRREEREATQESALLLGALIPPGARRTYRDSKGACIAEIRITEEEFRRAQEGWLDLLEKRLGEGAVIERLDELKNDIAALRNSLRAELRPQIPAPTAVQVSSNERLPLWPLALGTVGAASFRIGMFVEEQRYQGALSTRRLPRADLEKMVQRHKYFQQAFVGTAAFSLGYLVLMIASSATSSDRDSDDRNWQFGIEPGRIRLTWQLNSLNAR